MSVAPSRKSDTTAIVATQKGKSSFLNLMTTERWLEVARIAVTGFIALLYWRGLVPQIVLYGAVGLGLYPLAKIGFLALIRERKIGTEVFVTVATIVAMIGGETVAGAVLLVIILIAEFIAELNTERARASIRDLIGSIPEVAILRTVGGDKRVSISELKPGDKVLVPEGEKIPVDGKVVGGEAFVNEAPITGESVSKEKVVGTLVFAGTVVETGAIDVETQLVGKSTTFARIIALVEEADAQKAPVQKLTDKVAAWLIPVVFVFLVVVYVVTRDVKMIVTLLIFTSPAELGLATPIVMIAAIARAAQNGILVKGGAHLEALARVDTMVLDKTGTLTVGKPAVQRVTVLDQSLTELEVLRIAASADLRSAHPLAHAVVEKARSLNAGIVEPEEFETIRGRGVTAKIEGKRVLVGNAALLKENNVGESVGQVDGAETAVFVAMGEIVVGVIHIADEIRPGASEAIARLRRSGIKNFVMLTGDSFATAKAVASQVGIDSFEASLLPQDKVDKIRALQSAGASVAMVGDGINDAPALAAAEVGIAMGVGGTQAAIEAADIALMTDDLNKLVGARFIAKKAYRTIQENLLVGVGVVHVLGITAALLGWIGPIEAALIHLGPDILVFLNSVKLLRLKLEEPVVRSTA